MKPRPIPNDCIFEASGSLGDRELPSHDAEPSSTDDHHHESCEGGFVQRWRIDTKASLADLRRCLKIDAQPPTLNPLSGGEARPSSVTDPQQLRYGGLDLQSPSNGMQRDAAELLRDAEALFQRLHVSKSSANRFATSVEDLHRRVALLRPGYAAELSARVDATIKEASKWHQGKADVCRELSCNDEQLREMVQLVQFLNTEVAPAAPAVLAASKQVQTLAPLLQAASDRLEYLGVIGETSDLGAARRRVDEITAGLESMNAAIADCDEACTESLASLKERIENLKSVKPAIR